jgi:alkylated DNA repair dioxygenase AlkB
MEDEIESTSPSEGENRPKDGTIIKEGNSIISIKKKCVDSAICKLLYDDLIKLPYQQDDIYFPGKLFTGHKKIYYVGDRDIEYFYNGIKRDACPWTEGLLKCKKIVEEKTGQKFNFAIVSLYENGTQYTKYSSNEEKGIEFIAILSLGSQRDILLRSKDKEHFTIKVTVPVGSIMTFEKEFYKHWKYCTPERKNHVSGRIEISFRFVQSHIVKDAVLK